MTKVINLYGGPGTGKSTSAALLFSLLKNNNYNSELVQEYVKQWAWEERHPVKYDQFYFFGKQSRKEYSLFKNVDIIVTDSPISLCGYYTKVYGTPEQTVLFNHMAKTYYNMVKDDGVDYVHIWLNRVKAYNPKGRFQTEDEAKAIDKDMKEYLTKDLGLTLLEFDGSNEGVNNLFSLIAKSLNYVR